jgi:hypothetical protein
MSVIIARQVNPPGCGCFSTLLLLVIFPILAIWLPKPDVQQILHKDDTVVRVYNAKRPTGGTYFLNGVAYGFDEMGFKLPCKGENVTIDVEVGDQKRTYVVPCGQSSIISL